MDLMLISLMIDDVKYFLLCLLAIPVSVLERTFQIIINFKSGYSFIIKLYEKSMYLNMNKFSSLAVHLDDFLPFCELILHFPHVIIHRMSIFNFSHLFFSFSTCTFGFVFKKTLSNPRL